MTRKSFDEKVKYAFDSRWVREGSEQEAVALLFLEKGPVLFVGIRYYYISKKISFEVFHYFQE